MAPPPRIWRCCCRSSPMFGDAGFLLDAPTPSRWYLRLSPDAKLPDFAPPDVAIGDDLFEHLPAGESGRRWRALLTEAQVLLHQHPWNEGRVASGKPAINSLWFWGGGVLPHAVTSPHRQVRSRESLLRALALAAGADAQGEQRVDALVDLRHLRSCSSSATMRWHRCWRRWRAANWIGWCWISRTAKACRSRMRSAGVSGASRGYSWRNDVESADRPAPFRAGRQLARYHAAAAAPHLCRARCHRYARRAAAAGPVVVAGAAA